MAKKKSITLYEKNIMQKSVNFPMILVYFSSLIRITGNFTAYWVRLPLELWIYFISILNSFNININRKGIKKNYPFFLHNNLF